MEGGYFYLQLAEARRLYHQGRNYHLYRRYERARVKYLEILRKYPGTLYAEKSQFWLGQIFF